MRGNFKKLLIGSIAFLILVVLFCVFYPFGGESKSKPEFEFSDRSKTFGISPSRANNPAIDRIVFDPVFPSYNTTQEIVVFFSPGTSTIEKVAGNFEVDDPEILADFPDVTFDRVWEERSEEIWKTQWQTASSGLPSYLFKLHIKTDTKLSTINILVDNE